MDEKEKEKQKFRESLKYIWEVNKTNPQEAQKESLLFWLNEMQKSDYAKSTRIELGKIYDKVIHDMINQSKGGMLSRHKRSRHKRSRHKRSRHKRSRHKRKIVGGRYKVTNSGRKRKARVSRKRYGGNGNGIRGSPTPEGLGAGQALGGHPLAKNLRTPRSQSAAVQSNTTELQKQIEIVTRDLNDNGMYNDHDVVWTDWKFGDSEEVEEALNTWIGRLNEGLKNTPKERINQSDQQKADNLFKILARLQLGYVMRRVSSQTKAENATCSRPNADYSTASNDCIQKAREIERVYDNVEKYDALNGVSGERLDKLKELLSWAEILKTRYRNLAKHFLAHDSQWGSTTSL